MICAEECGPPQRSFTGKPAVSRSKVYATGFAKHDQGDCRRRSTHSAKC